MKDFTKGFLIASAVIWGAYFSTKAFSAERPNSATPGESCKLLRSGQELRNIDVPLGQSCDDLCDAAVASQRALDAPTKTSGSVRYTCRNDRSTTVSYVPNPPAQCPSYTNLPTTRTVNCSAGTSGTWTQTASFSQAPPPDCTVSVTWSPGSAPAGTCLPLPPDRTATLTWSHDGRNVTGFIVNYGASATTLTQAVMINDPAARSYRLTDLAPATYFFSVTARNGGTNSLPSNVVSKVIAR